MSPVIIFNRSKMSKCVNFMDAPHGAPKFQNDYGDRDSGLSIIMCGGRPRGPTTVFNGSEGIEYSTDLAHIFRKHT